MFVLPVQQFSSLFPITIFKLVIEYCHWYSSHSLVFDSCPTVSWSLMYWSYTNCASLCVRRVEWNFAPSSASLTTCHAAHQDPTPATCAPSSSPHRRNSTTIRKRCISMAPDSLFCVCMVQTRYHVRVYTFFYSKECANNLQKEGIIILYGN